MNPLYRIYNSNLVPAFLINSLPKSGTNLLEKVVRQFPGIRHSGIALDHDNGVRMIEQDGASRVTVPLGVDWPVSAPRETVRRSLRLVPRGCYAFGHVPFSPEMAGLLVGLGMKSVLILRDPRDVVVSFAKYVAVTPSNVFFDYFHPLAEPERITKAIVGIPLERNEVMKQSIRDSLVSVLPWRSQPSNYTTFFEHLVGPQGGGSREAQLHELEAIAHHLGVRCSRSQRESIADGLFGGTLTFAKGTIGGWREALNAEHKRLIKELLGDLLVTLGYEKDLNW